MNKPVLMTKLKNDVNKNKPGMNFCLRNIAINGVKKGCSGFIENPTNDSIVYVTTEVFQIGACRYMYRYADSMKDYTGYSNRWATSYESLISSLCTMLDKLPADVNDKRI